MTTYQKFDLGTWISLGTWKNLVYFQGSDDTNGIELWVSDGSLENTVMVQDICPGSCSSYPESFVSRDSSLYFVANDHISWFMVANRGAFPNLKRMIPSMEVT
ncbi:MAG: hypothetical protein IPN29_07440 [Saprospiraceae bacterium]|nr:hypothetical protein [Saprospiraceae bacterium]